jgi:hypothetical protein
MTRPFLLLLALTSTLELVCALIPHPVQQEPRLPRMSEECVTDWIAGYRDCEFRFADNTYVRSRAYGN